MNVRGMGRPLIVAAAGAFALTLVAMQIIDFELELSYSARTVANRTIDVALWAEIFSLLAGVALLAVARLRKA
jgi:hypothetical protein